MDLMTTQKVTPLECGLTHPHGGPCAAGPYPVRPGDPRCDAVVYLNAQLTSPCLLAEGHAGECDPDPGREPVPAWAAVRATAVPPDPAVAPAEDAPPLEGPPAPAPDELPDTDPPAPAPEEDAPGGTPTAPAADDDDDPDAQAGEELDDDPFTEGQ